MTKRPRLSANLRLPLEGAVEPTPAVPLGAETATAEPVQQTVATREAHAPAQQEGSSHRDHLSDIFVDAFTAMSLASYTGWSQAMICQWRLSSYVIERARMGR